MAEKFWYYVVKVSMKLHLYVLDYSFEPGTGADDGIYVMSISGRWRWQKP